MSKSEIAGCPCCGHEPEQGEQENDGVEMVNLFCGVEGCLTVETAWFTSLDEAIAAWNKRFVCLDKNGKAVYAGDEVKLSCGCCIYKIEIKNGFAVPVDDGQSQVHGKDFNVWEHEIELVEGEPK